MELKQAKGNTWYLADWQLTPLYMTDRTHCILIDTGDLTQREEIIELLKSKNITPVGILGTHVHTDHSPNHAFFKELYHIPLALSLNEAAICSGKTMLKAYYFMLTEGQILEFDDYSNMLVKTDRIILPEEDSISFCGAEFKIIKTPGHSPGHISIVTPDGVLCIGDALFSSDYLADSKLPYFFSLKTAIETMNHLKTADYPCYLLAHRGVCSSIQTLADENIKEINIWADRVKAVLDTPLSVGDSIAAVCKETCLLSSRVFKSTLYERNIRPYIDYLTDCGKLETFAKDGVTFYRPAG
ncbi:MAG: MBL fold metallo-hydrolase [Eubacterium sp.]|nr:MBL fold metallo-hydrolase [Eubacterium sp.]